jgi:bifunctional non-homologous end joining protein LigD
MIIGKVGSGMAGPERIALYNVLSAQRATAPVVPDELPVRVQWVVPTLVAEVAYRQYTAKGGLRHAAWKGLREVAADDSLYPLPAEDPEGPD